jgi:hypothetical protein
MMDPYVLSIGTQLTESSEVEILVASDAPDSSLPPSVLMVPDQAGAAFRIRV